MASCGTGSTMSLGQLRHHAAKRTQYAAHLNQNCLGLCVLHRPALRGIARSVNGPLGISLGQVLLTCYAIVMHSTD